MPVTGFQAGASTSWRKVALAATSIVDALTLAFMSLLGPAVGAAGLVFLALLIYCLFSPIGLVLMLSLISHVGTIGSIDEQAAHNVKWAITLFLFLFTLIRLATRSDQLKVEFGTIEKWFLVLVGWGLFCTLFAVQPAASLYEVVRITVFLIVYVVAKMTISRKGELHAILIVVLFAVLSSGVVSIATILHGRYARVHGFFSNANAFAIFLSFAIPIVAMGFFVFRQKTMKMLFAAGFIVGFLAILLSWSRASIVAVVAQLVVYLIVEKKKKVMLALFCLMIGGAVFYSASPGFRDLTSVLLRLQSGTANRTLLWGKSLDAFRSSPVVGLGYRVTKGDVASGVMWGDPVDYVLFSNRQDPFSPHNVYLHALMTTGLPGLVVFILFYRSLIWTQRCLWKSAVKPTERRIHAVMLSVLIGTLVHGLFETASFFGYGSFANYFWIALGMSEAIRKRNLLA